MNTPPPTPAGEVPFARLFPPTLRLVAIASLVLLGQEAMAQVVVSDPSALTWYQGRSADTITPGTGSVAFTEGSTSGSTYLTNFSPATVAVGSTLVATISFTTGATVINTSSQAFRIGLANNGTTPISANYNTNSPGGTPGTFSDDLGYMFYYNFDGATSLGMYARNSPSSTQLLSTTSGWTGLSGTPGGTAGALQAATNYTLTLTLAHTAGGYDFSGLLNGGLVNNYTLMASDLTSASSTLSEFNELAIYINGGTNTTSGITLTGLNIAVGAATPVPEPSTYAALAGLAALGMVAWRKRGLRAIA